MSLLSGAWLLPYVWAGGLWILGRVLFHGESPNLGAEGNVAIVALTWITMLMAWLVSVVLGFVVAVVALLAGDRRAAWRAVFLALGFLSAAAAFPLGLLCVLFFFV